MQRFCMVSKRLLRITYLLKNISSTMEKPRSMQRPWSKKPVITVAPMATRKRDPFYHTSRWRRLSQAFLKRNPLCLRCEQKGFTVPSEVTDHIIPKQLCSDPWDQTNWQPLCKKCNIEKGAEDTQKINQAR